MTDPQPAARDAISSGDTATATIGQQATAGVFWLTAQKWAVRLLGFVTIAVLTRLLSPEAFGTVAAASTVLPFFFLIADLGFAAYIVQVKDVDQRMLSTAFWFSLGAGAVLAATMAVLAPLLGAVFHDPAVVPVIQALSLWVVFTAVGSVPMALLRRRMRFRTLAVQGAIAAVIAQVVAMVIAFSGGGVWALVGQSLIAPAVTSVLAWITAAWVPSRGFSAAHFRAMTGFGSQVLGVEFVAMLRAWGEAAIISAVLGIGALGFLSVAQRLIQVVQDLTGSAIVPVTTVVFAKIREAPERLQRAYLRALRMVYALLSLPLTAVAVTAPLVVPIVFGPGWDPSFPVAQVLALAGILTVGAALDHGLFYGLGRPGTWFVYAVVIDALTVAVTAWLAPSGLLAVAWGFLGVCVIATVSRWYLTARLLRTRARTVAGPFSYLAVAVVCSGAAGWGVSILAAALPALVTVLLVCIAVAAVHALVTHVMAPRVLPEIWALLARSGVGRRLRLRGSGEARS